MEKITKRVVNIILFVAFVILIICIGISKKEESKIQSESIIQQDGDSTEKKLVTQIKEINQDNIGLDKEKVEKSVLKLDGITKVKVSLKDKTATIYSSVSISDEDIIDTINKLDYKVTSIGKDE